MIHPSTPPRGEFHPLRARSCIVRSLLYTVLMRRCALFLSLVIATPGAVAQSTWRVDSLLTTWPVKLALEEARHQITPGVVRAVDTRNLVAAIKKAAPLLPVFADSAVIRYTRLYGEPRREEFRALLGAARCYLPLIEGELLRQGLPKDLKYLPMALSAMNTQAGSSSGEAGLWMLNYPVAMRYGLDVSADVDERRDPTLATMAAVGYLKDLHERHQDWGLTVMAFACGPANLARAQGRTQGSREPAELYPHFTAGHRDVLPMLMAFIYLSAHATELGIVPLEVDGTEETDTLHTVTELALPAIASTLGMPTARLRAINPTLCSDRLPAFFTFHLPRGERERFVLLQDSIARVQQDLRAAPVASTTTPVASTADGREAIHYRVRSGDYLGRVAMRFGVKVSQIKTWNKLRSDRIDVGDKLVIYVPASQRDRYERRTTKADGEGSPTNSTTPKPSTTHAGTSTPVAGFTWYTVQAGDSLYAIARRFPGVVAKDLMQVNGISANIKPGQKLKIPVQP